jgi:hypothetical protein
MYRKKTAPQQRHTAHLTAHFPTEALVQRLLLCQKGTMVPAPYGCLALLAHAV